MSSVKESVLPRVLDEGYGGGAWHGPDMKTALAEVPEKLAFWRPTAGRHNIAEITAHHAYYVHSVSGQLSGTAEPFLFAGEDWFEVEKPWSKVQALIANEHGRLADVVSGIADGRIKPSLSEDEVFKLVLGITCHAVYHAGQVQLIRRLADGQ